MKTLRSAIRTAHWWAPPAHVPALLVQPVAERAAVQSRIDFVGIVMALAKQRLTGWITLEYVWLDWKYCN